VVLGTEIMVRMGELAVSRTPGEVLASIGLGSCIGLALVDRTRSLAGLAHVMLPESSATRTDHAPAKFANTGVPALLDRMRALGARPSRLEAVLVGGASMFMFGSSALDIGARNEQATLAELQRAGIPVVASETSGKTGRTIRVHVDGGVVVCKEAGGTETVLFGDLA
jgi:chemotaxis protein CheD